ncbi:MAG: hypothetical protein LW850_28575 [Planctomycetaceae bacterium]|nr:hypothetical protein [Planctomycetaceae bacterium]
MLPLNLPELEVSGLALVIAIDDCPPIADGEGSVVEGTFHVPSAVFNEVHIEPWLTAQRSVPATLC